MRAQGSALTIDLAEFAARLFANQEIIPRARTCAQIISQLISGSAVSVYLVGTQYGMDVWRVKSSAGEVSVHSAAVPIETGTLGEVAAQKAPSFFLARICPAKVTGTSILVKLSFRWPIFPC